MKIEKVKIEEVKLNENNPRTIKDEKFRKLVASIKEFPKMLEIRPIVVNEEMIVLGGNMRLRACIEAGLSEVHIIKANDLSELQQKEFIIKDNVGFGEWNWDEIANDWDETLLADWGLDLVVKQNWDNLDYINEAEQPNFRKDNVITIIVPEEFINEVKEIEQLIKDTLSVDYSGCEVK
jgi:hypothetical protein